MNPRLTNARRRCGLTQGQLAFMVGVSPPTIQRYETGYHAIPAERLAALARALDVPPEWLRGELGTETGVSQDVLDAFRRAERERAAQGLDAQHASEIEDAFERAKRIGHDDEIGDI